MRRVLAVLFLIGGAAFAGDPAPPKTIISGERMNLIDKGGAVEFSGGVKLRRGNDFLSADRMVSDEKKGLTRAWGNVYLRRDAPEEGLRWEAWSDRALYDADASSGTLWSGAGLARAKRTPLPAEAGAAALELEGERIALSRRPAPEGGVFTRLDAEGRVYALLSESTPTARETRVWAGRMTYDGAAGLAHFSDASAGPVPGFPAEWPEGRPRAFQADPDQERRLTAETLIYDVNEERLIADKDVRARIDPIGPPHGPGR